MDLSNVNLLGDVLIITGTDGSSTYIPEQDCTSDQQEIFNEFRNQYPNGK